MAKLLGEDNQTKPYIRHFTAEAFAFLLRKTRGANLSNIIKHMLTTLRSEPSKQFEEGLAMLFFESIKQVDHHIHSRGESIYKELLTQCYQEDVSVDNLSSNPIYNVLTKTTLLVLHHAYRQHFTPIINIILIELDAQLKVQPLNEKVVAIQASLLNMMVTVRKGSRVEDFKSVITRLQDLSKTLFTSPKGTYSNFLYTQTLRAVTGTLYNGSLEVVVSGGRVILETLSQFNDIDLVYGFYLSLAKLKWTNFTQLSLSYIIKYTSTYFSSNPFETILFLAEIFATDILDVNSGSMVSSVTAEGLLRFPAVKNEASLVDGILDILGKEYDWKQERDILNATDMNSEESDMSAITVLGSALSILPRIQISSDKVYTVVMSLFKSLAGFLDKNRDDNQVIDAPYVLGHKNFVLETLMGFTLESLASIAAHNAIVLAELKNIHGMLIDQVLVSYHRNEVVLSGIHKYLDLLYTG